MLYVNIKSFTCDIDGKTAELLSEFSMVTAQLHKLLAEEYGEEKANEMIAESGQIAMKARAAVENH